MKRKGTWIAVLAMITAAVGFGGCGKKPTAEEVLKKTQEAEAKVTAVNADWNMDLGVSVSVPLLGVDMNVGAKAEGNTQYSAEDKLSYTKAVIDISSMGEQESQSFEAYTEMPDEKTMGMYLLVEDQWLKLHSEIPETEEDSDSPEYLELLQSLTLAEESVKRDDAVCYQLEADIPLLEAIEKVQQVSEELEESLEQADVDLSMFRNKSVHVIWYVRQEDSLTQEIHLSLADTTPSVAQVSGEAEEETRAADETEAESEEVDYDLRFDTLDMTMIFDYPESVSVTIPEEARENAVDMEDAMSLSALDGDPEEDGFLGNDGSAYDKLTSPVIIAEYASGDPEAVVVEENGVQVSLSRVYTDGGENAYADFEITNGTDRDIELFSNGSAWNHVMNEYGFDLSVKAGETKIGCLNSPKLSDLQGDPAEISLKLICSDMKTYDDVFSTDDLKVILSEEVSAPAVREGGAIVYEDDTIQVTAYAPDTRQEYMASLPIAICNKTGKDLSISSMTVTIGGEEADAFIYGELFGNSIIYTSMDVFPEAGGKLPELKDVAFTLEAVDTTTYETVLTTEEIRLPE